MRRSAVDVLFDNWEQAWSGRDPAAFGDLCDPAVTYEDPLTEEPLRGADQIAARAAQIWAGFPDLRVVSIGPRLSDGTHASAPAKFLGTNTESLGSISATNRALELHVVFFAELRGDRLLRVRAFGDIYGAAVKLGILPKLGTIGGRALMLLRGFGLQRG